MNLSNDQISILLSLLISGLNPRLRCVILVLLSPFTRSPSQTKQDRPINSLIVRAWPCTFFSLSHRVAKISFSSVTRRTIPILINHFPPHDSKHTRVLPLWLPCYGVTLDNIKVCNPHVGNCDWSQVWGSTFITVWKHLWHIIPQRWFISGSVRYHVLLHEYPHDCIDITYPIACKTWLLQRSMCDRWL